MKSESEILSKIESMKQDLEEYKENWDRFNHIYPNGLAKKIEEDILYNSIINQLEVLKWVLKD